MPSEESFNDMLARAEQEKENKKRLPAVKLLLDDIIGKIDKDREVDDL